MNTTKVKIIRKFCILNKLDYKHAKKIVKAMKPEEQKKEINMMRGAINLGHDQLKKNKAKIKTTENLRYAARVKYYEEVKKKEAEKMKNLTHGGGA